MPNPQSQLLQVNIDGFQGIDIERGVLERAVNSFSRLDNFDMTKRRVLKKIAGNVMLSNISTEAIVALRDYQLTPASPHYLVSIDDVGIMRFQPNVLVSGNLCGADGNLLKGVLIPKLDTAPFMVSLPLVDTDLMEGVRNYIFVTLNGLADVQKWDGTQDPDGITVVGVANPTDSWNVQYLHSLIVPQQLYIRTDIGTSYYGTSPNASQGIPLVFGRRYRWTWYNPRTQHDSSLAANSLAPVPTDMLRIVELATHQQSPAKPGGVALTTNNASFLMAAPLFFDNMPNRLVAEPILSPGPGYTHVRVWATRDGGTDYWLVPRLYNQFGQVATDANGAIPIINLQYGMATPNADPSDAPMLWDGYIPHTNPFFPSPQYDDALQFTVNGGGQSGFTLNVTKNADPNVLKSQFQLDGDATVYTIVSSVPAGGSNFTWTIYPALVLSPNDASHIEFLQSKPVADTDLIIPFVPQNEPGIVTNTDRINDPPPRASWGVVYQNRLFLLNAADQTQLHFSMLGRYESFPPDNVMRFTQADFDPITALLTGRQVGLVSQGADAQLVVGKERTSAKITGTDQSDFAIQSMFAETGIVHKRAAVVAEGFFVGWSRRGLESFEPQQPLYVGLKIKDLWNKATFDDTFGPSFTTWRKEGQLLLGINLHEAPRADFTTGVQIDRIILMRPIIWLGSQTIGGQAEFESPFSKITALPTLLGILLESGFDDNVRVLAGGLDGNLYQLFVGGSNQATSGVEAVVATAETQELPQDDKTSRKIFRRIRFDGQNISGDTGWKCQFSVDGGITFSPMQRLFTETFVGMVGKQLIVRVIHDRAVGDNESPPMISNMVMEYSPIGESRGQPEIGE
jgi:hypothetical protein